MLCATIKRMSNKHELLTLAQVAARLGRNPEVVRRYVAAGLLPACKIGASWVVTPQDLALFVPPVRGRPPKPATE